MLGIRVIAALSALVAAISNNEDVMTTISSMTMDNFIVRPMKRSELDLVFDWAAAEGWNPGTYDAAECF
ncbi:MAG: hypothetical protein PUP91_08675 [Rhizonema sp. PD37]|nr:hypothetical protein [Rhizonema sp. PD37]